MENNKIIKHQHGSVVKHVSKAISIADKLMSPNLRSLAILHLDDHSLFATGIHNCLIKKFPNISIKHIQEGNEAFEYVKYCFANKKQLDLILTDLAHQGLNGIDFTKAVRELEKGSATSIPILFITMHSDKTVIDKGYEAGCSKWLTKDAGCEEISFAIKNFI